MRNTVQRAIQHSDQTSLTSEINLQNERSALFISPQAAHHLQARSMEQRAGLIRIILKRRCVVCRPRSGPGSGRLSVDIRAPQPAGGDLNIFARGQTHGQRIANCFAHGDAQIDAFAVGHRQPPR